MGQLRRGSESGVSKETRHWRGRLLEEKEESCAVDDGIFRVGAGHDSAAFCHRYLNRE